ncbi:Fructose-1,6-bisphosphatase [Lachnospiraceae bacterium TWA4]|nr:Fructose-1,6-bisphosphatase [Lachnospiraceae bacterium TWA4]
MNMRYLRSLSKRFPNIAKASTEIVNLSAILNLPKGTEHYVSDLHGENEQFLHVLKNGSGAIKRKIEEEYGNTLSYRDKRTLATLIYYPQKKLELMQSQEDNIEDWYKIIIYRLIHVTRAVATKYTRSKVRKALPPDFAYIFEELIYKERTTAKHDYYDDIIHTIIRIDRAPACIIALCELIQRLVIDHLHVLGDIYDRGSGPHIIMDTLINYHSVDIQWGNHDITWMAAASGHLASIATILRIAARYGELDVVEDGYGINLIPLLRFVSDTYKNVPGKNFDIHYNEATYDVQYMDIDKRMQKALAVIQFKLEGQIIKNHPEFHMDDRLLLDKIDYVNKTVTLEGVAYAINDTDFPTIDPANPYALSEEEAMVMERIRSAFLNSEKLQRHIKFLYEKGSLYLVHNNNLLFHGCVPLNESGNFLKVTLEGKKYCGKALYDQLDTYARKAYYLKPSEHKTYCQDIMWFIWCNAASPLFGKHKMATFERYFIDDETTWKERKNPYYKLYDDQEIVYKIMREFGINPETGHIINGHVPVKSAENPVKCNGKLFVIDGGFSKAYQKTTGIAGYTLVCNSYGLQIASHKPFSSAEEAVKNETDVHTETVEVEFFPTRKLVRDTDVGKELQEQIEDLEELLEAYRNGTMRQSY